MTIKAFTIAVLLLSLHTANAEQLTGYLVAITDGDTLTLLVDQKPHKVRVVGIDAPERRRDSQLERINLRQQFGSLESVLCKSPRKSIKG